MKKVCEGVANKETKMHILKREEFPFDNLLEPNFYYHEVSIFSLLQATALEEHWLKQQESITYSHFFYYHGKYYLCVRMRGKK